MNTAPSLCCISFDSYIKPQPATCGPIPSGSCISFDSYIKPQQIDLYPQPPCSCISFDSYIKPQQIDLYPQPPCSCISFDSYIKPQPGLRIKCSVFGCISFDSYIKPQRGVTFAIYEEQVVYLLIPTSNHNPIGLVRFYRKLYIFWFLHQTTTNSPSAQRKRLLYIFWFLHQTTTRTMKHHILTSCISFDSYIKPQRILDSICLTNVVYLLIPTSNHNHAFAVACKVSVVYLLIPTSNHNLDHDLLRLVAVVYLLIPTSNHNELDSIGMQQTLYIFWFLHQTTTKKEGD